MLPLETTKSRLFRLFRLFWRERQIQAALPYPSDRSGRNGQNPRNTLVCGFWPSRGPLVPPDPDRQGRSGGPTPGPLNRPGSLLPGLPGGHTARFSESDGSAFFDISGKKCQKSMRRRQISGLHTAHSCSKRALSWSRFIDFSVFSRDFRTWIPAPCSAFLSRSEESELLLAFWTTYEWGRLNSLFFLVFSRVSSYFSSKSRLLSSHPVVPFWPEAEKVRFCALSSQ